MNNHDISRTFSKIENEYNQAAEMYKKLSLKRKENDVQNEALHYFDGKMNGLKIAMDAIRINLSALEINLSRQKF